MLLNRWVRQQRLQIRQVEKKKLIVYSCLR